MPTLLYKEFGLVKGVGFDSWRRVGAAMQSFKVYNMREVDELVFLDITATQEGRPPDFRLIDELADECFMPLAVGGGVRSVADVDGLLKVGADKVVVNTAAIDRPELVREISNRYGSQCIVVSIDARSTSTGKKEVFVESGTRSTGRDPVDVARESEANGAGELMITSIERDGTMEGYDIDLVRSVCNAVSIPVIASGGAGNYGHLTDALRIGASAVAAASMFHFTEQTPRDAKKYLGERGFPVRR